MTANWTWGLDDADKKKVQGWIANGTAWMVDAANKKLQKWKLQGKNWAAIESDLPPECNKAAIKARWGQFEADFAARKISETRSEEVPRACAVPSLDLVASGTRRHHIRLGEVANRPVKISGALYYRIGRFRSFSDPLANENIVASTPLEHEPEKGTVAPKIPHHMAYERGIRDFPNWGVRFYHPVMHWDGKSIDPELITEPGEEILSGHPEIATDPAVTNLFHKQLDLLLQAWVPYNDADANQLKIVVGQTDFLHGLPGYWEEIAESYFYNKYPALELAAIYFELKIVDPELPWNEPAWTADEDTQLVRFVDVNKENFFEIGHHLLRDPLACKYRWKILKMNPVVLVDGVDF